MIVQVRRPSQEIPLSGSVQVSWVVETLNARDDGDGFTG
jgi:hypothetical protein